MFQKITVAYVNEVIKDISEKDEGSLNIIMTDEIMPDVSDTASEFDDTSVTYDWTSLDIDVPNIFIMAAFNPTMPSTKNAKLKIQTPGVEMANFKDADIDEILRKCGNTTKALHQQLHVGYRSAMPIAKLVDFFKSHYYGKRHMGKIDDNFRNIWLFFTWQIKSLFRLVCHSNKCLIYTKNTCETNSKKSKISKLSEKNC